jgi:hypothetical protein
MVTLREQAPKTILLRLTKWYAMFRTARIHKGAEIGRNDQSASKSIKWGHTGQQVTE